MERKGINHGGGSSSNTASVIRPTCKVKTAESLRLPARTRVRAPLSSNQAVPVPVPSIHGLLVRSLQSGVVKLSNRGLQKIPPEVYHVHNISFEGKEWWTECDIHRLDISGNEISEIDDAIANLTALRAINVTDNQLTSLPASLAELKYLASFAAAKNQLNALPPTFAGCSHLLTDLNLSANRLTHIPLEVVRNLSSLEFFNVSDNQLSTFPIMLFLITAKRLQTMNLSKNKISDLNASGVDNQDPTDGIVERALPIVANCLTELDVSGNLVNEECWSQGWVAPNLQLLNLSHNRFRCGPTLRGMGGLIEVRLSHNHLTTLPDFTLLPRLQVLELRDNKIEGNLEGIDVLHELKRLDVTNNNLTGLSASLGQLTQLTHLLVVGNPMRSVRHDLLQKGTLEILKYLRTRLKSNTDGEQGNKENTTSSSPSFVDLRNATLDLSRGEGAQRRGEFPSVDEMNRLFGGHEVHATCAQLKRLQMNDQALAVFPTAPLTSLFTHLRHLELRGNTITTIPDALYAEKVGLDHLVHLDLSRNALTCFPSRLILRLPLLTHLNLEMNQLKTCEPIPAMVFMSPLSELNLNGNRLESLPPILVSHCTALVTLLCNNNKLIQVTPEITKLTHLCTLDLSNNSLSDFPLHVGHMPNLRSLKLEGNALRWLRNSILQQGTSAVLKYLRDRIPT